MCVVFVLGVNSGEVFGVPGACSQRMKWRVMEEAEEAGGALEDRGGGGIEKAVGGVCRGVSSRYRGGEG